MIEDMRDLEPTPEHGNDFIAVVSGSFDLNKLKRLFGDLYLEGYYDRDWKIDQDSADEKSEKLAVEKMLDKCRV